MVQNGLLRALTTQVQRALPLHLKAGITAPRKVYTAGSLSKMLLSGGTAATLQNIRRTNAALLTEHTACDASFERPTLSGPGLAGYNNPPGDMLHIYSRDRKTLLVGDLHGNLERFNELMARVTPDLKDGRINLIFLGDALHHESDGQMRQMKASRTLLNAIIMLKSLHPEQVHFLPGNHDTILPNITDIEKAKDIVDIIRRSPKDTDRKLLLYFLKNKQVGRAFSVAKAEERADGSKEMVYQGLRYLRDLVDSLGREDSFRVAELIVAYQTFFDRCPLSAVIEGTKGVTFAAHSPIIRGGISGLADLIAARSTDRGWQLRWNKKLKKTTPEQNEGTYTEKDVTSLLTALGRVFSKPVNIVGGHESDKDGNNWNFLPYPIIPRFTLIHGNVAGSMGWVEITEDGTHKGPHSIITKAKIA